MNHKESACNISCWEGMIPTRKTYKTMESLRNRVPGKFTLNLSQIDFLVEPKKQLIWVLLPCHKSPKRFLLFMKNEP